MTLTQLEYIVAVDTYRHFARAAENCFVTQPTLSMQINKLEKELGIKIFDRSRQPVLTTEAGEEVIIQARKMIHEKQALVEMVQAHKGMLVGELRIGIIPTLAPYLLPLVIPGFTKKYPLVKLIITEMTTESIISRLKNGRINAGILVTPLNENGIREDVLFYEEMVAYVSRKNAAYKKTYVLPQDIDPEKLWLLEEGHCFRSQIVNLCELRRDSREGSHFEYEAGSVETLRRLVEINDGITILPELATMNLTNKQLELVRHFRRPSPVREVSLVVHRDLAKEKLVTVLKNEIIESVPDKIRKNRSLMVVPV